MTKPKTSKKPKDNKPKWAFKTLDLIGSKFSFKFASTRSGKFQTKLGSLLTLLIVLSIIFASILILKTYLDTSSPAITFSAQMGEEVAHNLYEEGVLTPFMLQDNFGFAVQNISRFITIKGFSITFSYNISQNRYNAESLTMIDFRACDQLNDPILDNLIKDSVAAVNITHVIQCPDLSQNPGLGEVYEGDKESWFKRLVVKIMPCSLPNPSDCANATEMEDFILASVSISKLMVPSNYKDPFMPKISTREIKIDPYSKKFNTFRAKINKVYDLRSVLLGPQKRADFVTLKLTSQDFITRDSSKLHCREEDMVKIGGCPEYVVFEYKGGSEVSVIERKYKLTTEVFGELGGILKVVAVFMFLYSFWNQYSKKVHLGAEAFGVLNGRGVFKRLGLFFKASNFRDFENSVTPQVRRRSKKRRRKEGRGAAQGPRESKADGQRTLRVAESPQMRNKELEDMREKVVQKSMLSCLKSRTTYQELVRQLNFVEVLENLSIEKEYEILVHLAVLRERQVLDLNQKKIDINCTKKGKNCKNLEEKLFFGQKEKIKNFSEKNISRKIEPLILDSGEKMSQNLDFLSIIDLKLQKISSKVTSFMMNELGLKHKPRRLGPKIGSNEQKQLLNNPQNTRKNSLKKNFSKKMRVVGALLTTIFGRRG